MGCLSDLKDTQISLQTKRDPPHLIKVIFSGKIFCVQTPVNCGLQEGARSPGAGWVYILSSCEELNPGLPSCDSVQLFVF